MEINLRKIKMPDDVIFETSSDTIPVKGNLSGDPDEIIVITQFRRRLYSGTVCHLERGSGMNFDLYIIRDLPGFKEIRIPQEDWIYEFDGVKYIMACLGEKEADYSLSNWLY